MPNPWISLLIFNILLSTIVTSTFAQDASFPSKLISEKKFYNHEFQPRKPSYMFKNHPKKWVKYNPVSLIFGGLLLFYQGVISEQFFTKCSYEISCSGFAKACIQEYGLFKGIPLAADRLTRCTQLGFIDVINSDIDFKNQKVKDSPSRYHIHHSSCKH